MCDMSELHKFIEETLGRAIYTHELADDETLNELRDKVRDEFLKIATNACDESNAEVAEVKHGRWSSNSIAIVCSECGKAFGLVEMFAHYCPSCGAKMDLEE